MVFKFKCRHSKGLVSYDCKGNCITTETRHFLLVITNDLKEFESLNFVFHIGVLL